MPPHTRSQRRRQPARQQPRQRVEQSDSVNDVVSADQNNAILVNPMDGAHLAPLQEVPVGTAVRAEAARTATTRRPNSAAASNVVSSTRRRARPDLAPVDYTSDYRSARHDLRWIAIWTGLLFVGMIALRLSGIAL